jgi:hypothetical protein
LISLQWYWFITLQSIEKPVMILISNTVFVQSKLYNITKISHGLFYPSMAPMIFLWPILSKGAMRRPPESSDNQAVLHCAFVCCLNDLNKLCLADFILDLYSQHYFTVLSIFWIWKYSNRHKLCKFKLYTSVSVRAVGSGALSCCSSGSTRILRFLAVAAPQHWFYKKKVL